MSAPKPILAAKGVNRVRAAVITIPSPSTVFPPYLAASKPPGI